MAVVALDTVPLTLAPATAFAVVAYVTAPVTFAPAIALSPLPLPVKIPVLAVMFAAVIVPLTPKLVNVPVLVIFGCALVVTVPAVVAEFAEPLNDAVIIFALKLPLASRATTLFAVAALVASTAIVFAVPPLKLVPVK